MLLDLHSTCMRWSRGHISFFTAHRAAITYLPPEFVYLPQTTPGMFHFAGQGIEVPILQVPGYANGSTRRNRGDLSVGRWSSAVVTACPMPAYYMNPFILEF
jgi:hypothetical protein